MASMSTNLDIDFLGRVTEDSARAGRCRPQACALPKPGHDVAEQVARANPEDLTNTCYVLVDGGHGGSTEPQVVIDLSPERVGRCYATSWDTRGLVGDMPVVALSVVELLENLLRDGGTEPLPTSTYDRDAYDA